MEQTTTLKPCPFCGGHSAPYPSREEVFGVICLVCGADGPQADSEAGAIVAWNRRPTEQELLEALIELVHEWDSDYNGFRFAEALAKGRKVLSEHRAS